jgi:hypothetical protein
VAIALDQGPDRCAQPARRIVDAGDQSLLQPRALDADAGADIAPERLDIAFAQHLAGLVTEAPEADASPGPLHRRIEVQGAQHAYAVGVHHDTAALGAPRRAALDKLHPKALPAERTGERESRDPTTDDQDCLDFGHVYSGIPTTRALVQTLSLRQLTGVGPCPAPQNLW